MSREMPGFKKLTGEPIGVTFMANGMQGRPCISIDFPGMQFELRLPLQDAESFGELILEVLRKGEELYQP